MRKLEELSLLERYEFIPLGDFIKQNYNLYLEISDIFIRCDVEIVVYENIKDCSNAEMISKAISMANERNHLINGYSSYNKSWYQPNTTLNLIKTMKWAEIFDALGTSNSIFLLTKCEVLERINNNFVFICGDFDRIFSNAKKAAVIERFRIFYGKESLNVLDIDKYLNSKDFGCEDKIRKIFNNYSKLNLSAIFTEYFVKGRQIADTTNFINTQIDSKKIISFLFLISKKILKPAFTKTDYKILLGKLTILIKRNRY